MAHGGRGEAVNTADCGSVMRGFDPHPPPQFIFWGVAKSVRHRTLTPACVGSSPAAPATLFLLYGALAQLVEHLTFNQGVPSSSLGCITKNFPVSVRFTRPYGYFFMPYFIFLRSMVVLLVYHVVWPWYNY